MEEIKVFYKPEVEHFLNELIYILYKENYFSYLENAIDYKDKIIDFIEENIVLIACAVAGGITGSYIGLKLLKKVTLEFIQKLVAVLLIVLSIALGAGLI